MFLLKLEHHIWSNLIIAITMKRLRGVENVAVDLVLIVILCEIAYRWYVYESTCISVYGIEVTVGAHVIYDM